MSILASWFLSGRLRGCAFLSLSLSFPAFWGCGPTLLPHLKPCTGLPLPRQSCCLTVACIALDTFQLLWGTDSFLLQGPLCSQGYTHGLEYSLSPLYFTSNSFLSFGAIVLLFTPWSNVPLRNPHHPAFYHRPPHIVVTFSLRHSPSWILSAMMSGRQSSHCSLSVHSSFFLIQLLDFFSLLIGG